MNTGECNVEVELLIIFDSNGASPRGRAYATANPGYWSDCLRRLARPTKLGIWSSGK